MIHYVDSFPDREIIIEGKKYLYFGGTSYLGLQTDPEFQSIFINNIRKYGTSYGASRNSNVRISIYEKVENWLAELVGSEKCITMSSGYLAGQLLVQHFNSHQFKLFYAPNTHSALHHSKTKDFATFSSLNIAVRAHLESNKQIKPVILVDSVDFSGCNYPNFDGLRSLPLEKLILIVDDSHGIGIIGTTGGGVFQQLLDFGAEKLIVCASLGKGFGIQSGAIFGTKNIISQLLDSAIFGSASPACPAAMATLQEGKEIIAIKRDKLRLNTELFISNMAYIDRFRCMKGHPTFSFADPGLATYMENEGIITTNFKYPTKNGNIMSRLVLSANHLEEDILKLGDLVNRYYDDISENI